MGTLRRDAVRPLPVLVALLMATTTLPVFAVPALADGGAPQDPITGETAHFLGTALVGDGEQVMTLRVPWAAELPPGQDAATLGYTYLLFRPTEDIVPAAGKLAMIEGVSRCVNLGDDAPACSALTSSADCASVTSSSYCMEADATTGGVRVNVEPGQTELRLTTRIRQQAVAGTLHNAAQVRFGNDDWATPAYHPTVAVDLISGLPLVSSFLVRTAADGGGEEVTSLSLTTDDLVPLFAAGYSADGAFVADQSGATWTLATSDVGTLSDAQGASTVFDPQHEGATVLEVNVGELAARVPIDVALGEPVRIVIRDSPREQGSEVRTLSLTSDDKASLFAAAYDADDNYIGDVDAAWTVTGIGAACGAVETQPQGLAVFDPHTIDVLKCRIHAAAGTATDSTGDVTVTAGVAAGISIRSAPKGGAQVGAVTLSADEEMRLYAVRTDADGNPTPDAASVQWRVLGGCGRIDKMSGPSVTFDAILVTGAAGDCRVLATTVSQIPTVIDALPLSLLIPESGPVDLGEATLTGVITVTPGAADSLKIRTAAGGAGVEVGSPTYTTDLDITLYAAGYDANGNYVGDLAATQWSISDATLATIGMSGASVALDPQHPGTLTVSAATPSVSDDTGAIAIVVGEVSVLRIRGDSGASTATADVAIPSGGAWQAHAAAEDADGNYIGEVFADWSLIDACGTLDLAEGFSTNLTAGNAATENCRVRGEYLGSEGASGLVTVLTLPPVGIAIRDAGEADVLAFTRSAGHPIVLIAAGLNGEGAFIGNQSATWAVVTDGGQACGTLDPEVGPTTSFTPTTVGVAGCRIQATVAGESEDIAVETGIITVNPGITHDITVDGIPETMVANVFPELTIRVFDEYGNPNTTFGGKIRYTLTGRVATPPASAESVPADTVAPTGVLVVPASALVVKKTGERTLTIVALIGAAPVATSQHVFTFNVVPAPLDGFLVTPPATTATAGAPFAGNFVVTARDAYLNTKTDYTGLVTASTGDEKAILPAGLAFLDTDAGVITVPGSGIEFRTAASQTVRITDDVSGKFGTTAPIAVTPAPAVRFAVTLPGQTFVEADATITGAAIAQAPDVAFTVEVRAVDAFGNVLKNTGDNRYTGAKELVLSGPALAWDGTSPTAKGSVITNLEGNFGSPTGTSFSATTGVGTFAIKLYRQESVAITVTDTTLGKSGTSSLIEMGTGAPFQLGLVVDCDPAAKNRDCLVASEAVTAPWQPEVSHIPPYHLRLVQLDMWDNMISGVSAIWLAPEVSPPIATRGSEHFWRPSNAAAGTLTLTNEDGLVARSVEIQPTQG